MLSNLKFQCSLPVVFLVAATVTSARAADIEVAYADWTGFHIGAGVGYGMVDHELNADVFIPTFGGVGPIPALDGVGARIAYDGIGGAGGLLTIEAGYDYQFHNNYLVGLQADYTRSSISTDIDLGGTGSYSLEATDTINVLARGGYVVDNSTLMYVIGGWTHTKMNADVSGLGNTSYGFNLDGVTFGSGVETALADNLTAKLEYRYTKYNSIDVVEVPGILDVSAKSDVQTVRGVLSYHMGGVSKYEGDFSEADWTGFHAGLGLGAGIMLHDISGSTAFGGGEFRGLGGKGFFGTVEAGADYQLGERFVFGVAADYTRSDIETSLDVAVTNVLGIDGALNASLGAQENLSILGRVGVLSSPKVLWYGLGGWTHTKFEGRVEATDSTGNVLFAGKEKLTADGLTFGVGVEAKLNERFSWKTEYRLSSFDNLDLLGSGLSSDSYMQTVRSVLSVRF